MTDSTSDPTTAPTAAPATDSTAAPAAGLTIPTIRAAYDVWPKYNRRLRDAVAALTDEQLGICPSAERWPLWATVGHLACQRVFWLCDFAGQPGAETTPFTNAAYVCPGDEDPTPLGTAQLVQALDSTFRIVETCLDTWPVASLADVVSHPDWGDGWSHTRGWALQQVFSHDVYHTAELNEALGNAGVAQIDLWG